MADTTVDQSGTDNGAIELQDVNIGTSSGAGGGSAAGSPETEGRKRVVWVDAKGDKQLAQRVVSTRLHYSVNYNSGSFSGSPVAGGANEPLDNAAAESGPPSNGAPGEPANPKIENCCVIS